MQALLGRAAESQKANSDLSEGAKVPRYEWAAALERRERKSKSGGDEGAEAKAEVENGGMKTEMPEVDVGKMLDEYKLAHPDFLVNADANGKTIKVRVSYMAKYSGPLTELRFSSELQTCCYDSTSLMRWMRVEGRK